MKDSTLSHGYLMSTLLKIFFVWHLPAILIFLTPYISFQFDFTSHHFLISIVKFIAPRIMCDAEYISVHTPFNSQSYIYAFSTGLIVTIVFSFVLIFLAFRNRDYAKGIYVDKFRNNIRPFARSFLSVVIGFAIYFSLSFLGNAYNDGGNCSWFNDMRVLSGLEIMKTMLLIGGLQAGIYFCVYVTTISQSTIINQQ
ncbi:hypothetical protein [Aminobacter carboxidus]|uniref:Uncharacterized protein n=1 Tax=Aminobacter carboxidus TaxID=376165 RepID=A0ABR9GY64_9HYPH|nr:hypothetical protein [Aminobacter carboxidus]MBE1208474.1 hypothetical protein [Aminobacter carboxidus]